MGYSGHPLIRPTLGTYNDACNFILSLSLSLLPSQTTPTCHAPTPQEQLPQADGCTDHPKEYPRLLQCCRQLTAHPDIFRPLRYGVHRNIHLRDCSPCRLSPSPFLLEKKWGGARRGSKVGLFRAALIRKPSCTGYDISIKN